MRRNRDYEIALVGAPGTGKTSLIASMYDEFARGLQQYDLVLEASDPRTRNYLSDSLERLRVISSQLVVDEPGIGSSPLEFKELDFILKNPSPRVNRRSSSKGAVTIRFTDYPGEWLGVNEELQKRIRSSPAILITIDAPSLMWEQGRLNANLPERVRQVVADWLDEGTKEPRLVMFCPIKCEKWMDSPQAQSSLKEAVKESFAATLGRLRGSKQTKVIYSPVMTTGSLRHNRFEERPDGVYESRFLGRAGGSYDPAWVLNPLIASLRAVAAQAREDEHVWKYWTRGNRELRRAAREFAQRPLEGPAEVWQSGE